MYKKYHLDYLGGEGSRPGFKCNSGMNVKMTLQDFQKKYEDNKLTER